jgi:hypothetical protein
MTPITTGAPAMAILPLPTAQAVDILAQFARVTDHWSPKVVTQVNDQYVKVARLLGEMDWHRHANEDELFWVLRGHLAWSFAIMWSSSHRGSAASSLAMWSTTPSPPRSAGSC